MSRIRERDYRGVDPGREADRSTTWRLRQPLVPATKAAIRMVGTATARWRCLPDYLIIGAKRSGSTTLARNLVADPDVMGLFPTAEDRKGIYYFDAHYDRGPGWYSGHFPLELTRRRRARMLGRPVVVGEASPWYLHHPHAPARAAALLPQARIICAVRDPVDRAHSHYRERVRQGVEPLGSFAEAVAAEPGRLAGEWEQMLDDPDYVSLAHLNFGYQAQSRYGDALDRWARAFGRDRMLVIASSELFADPAATLNRVRRFVGLQGSSTQTPRHFNRLESQGVDAELVSQIENNTKADWADTARWIDHQ